MKHPNLIAFAIVGAALCSGGAAPLVAQQPIGPGFDCAKAMQPLARMICSSPELSRTDLLFNQAYQALRQQLDPAGQRQLAQDDLEFLDYVKRFCGVPDTGAVTGSPDCVAAQYDRQREQWLSRLSGPAREEANRPIEQHVALQADLQRLGFLPSTAKIDGVYSAATRSAIVAWQHANGRPATGLIGDADAAPLGGAAPLAQAATLPAPRPGTMLASPDSSAFDAEEGTRLENESRQHCLRKTEELNHHSNSKDAVILCDTYARATGQYFGAVRAVQSKSGLSLPSTAVSHKSCYAAWQQDCTEVGVFDICPKGTAQELAADLGMVAALRQEGVDPVERNIYASKDTISKLQSSYKLPAYAIGTVARCKVEISILSFLDEIAVLEQMRAGLSPTTVSQAPVAEATPDAPGPQPPAYTPPPTWDAMPEHPGAGKADTWICADWIMKNAARFNERTGPGGHHSVAEIYGPTATRDFPFAQISNGGKIFEQSGRKAGQ